MFLNVKRFLHRDIIIYMILTWFEGKYYLQYLHVSIKHCSDKVHQWKELKSHNMNFGKKY